MAKTVYRDKSGRQIDLAVEAAKRKAEERAKMEEDDKFAEWGRGWVYAMLCIYVHLILIEVLQLVNRKKYRRETYTGC